MKKLLLLLLLLLPSTAFAQTPVYQSGTVTPGDPAMWTAQRFIGDATLNGGFTNWLMTSTTASLCINSALATNPYEQLCFGATSSTSQGVLTYSAFNGAATQSFLFNINGGNIVMNASALTLGTTSSQGSIVINGSTSGGTTLKTAAIAGTPTWIFPITSGTTGQVPASGGGSAAMTWYSVSGNSSTLLLLDSSTTNGHCANFDSSGGVIDSGASCAASGVGAGTAGNIPYYAVSGSVIAANTNLNISTAALTVGVAGSSQGSLTLTGAGAGGLTFAVPSSVTSYTLTFPSAVPATGFVLTASNGTGTLKWASPGIACCTYENTSFAATSNTGYCVDTSGGAVTATLEASPASNDGYIFLDCKNSFSTANLTLARNGNPIMNVAANFVDNVANFNFTLQWDSTGSNWIVR